MFDFVSPLVQDYILDFYKDRNKELKTIKNWALKNYIPIIDDDVTEMIISLLRIIKPNRILEIGTAVGYSSLIMALNTPMTTEIVTIEKDTNMCSMAEKNISEFQLENRIKILKGEALEILDTLDMNFDVVFMDAAKGQYSLFFEKIYPTLNKGSLILSDNIFYKGLVIEEQLSSHKNRTIMNRLKAYNQQLAELEDGHTVFLPIGDGFSVTVKENGNEKN